MGKQAAEMTAQMRSVHARLNIHDAHIDQLRENCTVVKQAMESIDEDMDEVKGGIKKLVDHITDTHLG